MTATRGEFCARPLTPKTKPLTASDATSATATTSTVAIIESTALRGCVSLKSCLSLPAPSSSSASSCPSPPPSMGADPRNGTAYQEASLPRASFFARPSSLLPGSSERYRLWRLNLSAGSIYHDREQVFWCRGTGPSDDHTGPGVQKRGKCWRKAHYNPKIFRQSSASCR